jgi:epoxyqueuosine reductase QueG
VRRTLHQIRAAAARHGLNLVAAIAVARYDASVRVEARAARLDPHARCVVVVGNGGGAFWKALRVHADSHPGWWQREHPLDDFTREVVERELAAPPRARGIRCTTVYPFGPDGAALDFVQLGKAAGLGGPSLLGVLVHPKYGPWIAFRAAMLLDEEIDAPGDAPNFDPCPSCTARTCIAACPVSAVSFPKGWDVWRCLEYRVEVETDCAGRCHSRVACVLGPEHRYPDDELAYHQERALRVMRPYYTKKMREKE